MTGKMAQGWSGNLVPQSKNERKNIETKDRKGAEIRHSCRKECRMNQERKVGRVQKSGIKAGKYAG